MRSRSVLLALCGVVPVALTMSCEPLSEGSLECDSTADCSIGDVCILPERQCVPEQMDSVVGSFSCQLLQPSDPLPDLGATDVIANVQGERWPLTHSAECNVTDSGSVLVRLSLYESDESTISLVFLLPFENVMNGQTVIVDREHGILYTEPSDVDLGLMDGTTVYVSPTQIGGRLSGYVRGPLVPPN
jgi:hypothetical protein